MFYKIKGLKTTLKIEPENIHQLGAYNFIISQIKQKVEGRYFDELGFILLVTRSKEESNFLEEEAFVDEDGSLSFRVYFEALVFRIKKSEFIDCIAEKCDAECIYTRIGPIQVLISREHIPSNYEFRGESYFIDSDEIIKVGSKLRIRILNLFNRNNEVKAFGVMVGKDINHLVGPIDDDLKFI